MDDRERRTALASALVGRSHIDHEFRERVDGLRVLGGDWERGPRPSSGVPSTSGTPAPAPRPGAHHWGLICIVTAQLTGSGIILTRVLGWW